MTTASPYETIGELVEVDSAGSVTTPEQANTLLKSRHAFVVHEANAVLVGYAEENGLPILASSNLVGKVGKFVEATLDRANKLLDKGYTLMGVQGKMNVDRSTSITYLLFSHARCSRCGTVLTDANWPIYHRPSATYHCKRCSREHGKEYARRWRARVGLDRRMLRHRQLKQQVLAHYGLKGQPLCVRCGFGDIRALTIDHIAGGGTQHRKTMSSQRIYADLKRVGYPEGYQTLCMNCQWVKRVENQEFGNRFKVSKNNGGYVT